MPVRSAPFDVEPLHQANYIIVPDEAPACACGANGTVWVSRDRGAKWAPAKSSGTVSDLYGCLFVDNLRGWACGERGVVIATTDGGVRWTKQASPTTDELHAVTFSDAHRGVITGARGTTLSTNDGGETWVLVEAVD